jgi:hypothetical protein
VELNTRIGVIIFVIFATTVVMSKLFWRTPENISSPPISQTLLLPVTTPYSKTPPPPNPCRNIYQLVCQKGEIYDPTGTVRSDFAGEKQAHHLYEEIIRKHPNWGIAEIDEEVVKQIFTSRPRSRLINAFQWVKKDLEKFIDQQPNTIFNSQEKQSLKARIRKTQLQIPPPASVYSDEPDLITKNEVYYERMVDGQMRLRVGGAFVFIAKSWFNLVFTFAHELAHAIDPCEIRYARLSFPAYDRLAACFFRNHLIATRKDRLECGPNDQLSETFADWIAVQITSHTLTSFSREFHGLSLINAARNSVKDLCEQEDAPNELDFEFHPPPQVRIEKIFGRNPTIRRILGCPIPPENLPYCDFDSKID